MKYTPTFLIITTFLHFYLSLAVLQNQGENILNQPSLYLLNVLSFKVSSVPDIFFGLFYIPALFLNSVLWAITLYLLIRIVLSVSKRLQHKFQGT